MSRVDASERRSCEVKEREDRSSKREMELRKEVPGICRCLSTPKT